MVRILILFLFCFYTNAQVTRDGNILQLHENRYVMIGDMLDYYSSRDNYNTISHGPVELEPYIEAFVRDALIYERAIDGITPLTYSHGGGYVTTGATIAPTVTWNCDGCAFGPYEHCDEFDFTWDPIATRYIQTCVASRTIPAATSGLPAGTSTGRIGDKGYNVRVRDRWWNIGASSQARWFLMYHELGHAMLELNHECDPNEIMYTSAITRCAEFDLERSLEQSIEDMFTNRGTPIIGSSLSGKGQSTRIIVIDD